MGLTNREMCGYFRVANIVKNHKLPTVIERHCLTMEFITQLELGDSGDFQDMLGKFLRAIGEFLNTDARGNNLGGRMFLITRK